MNTATQISLRPVIFEDAETIFRWRNDPFIVRLGSLQRKVSWDEHVRWLKESLASDEHRIFLIQGNGAAIGQIRFDRVDTVNCVVSVYLSPESTGQGWGIKAIQQACELIFASWNVDRVLAHVRADNRAGQIAFKKAGFKEVEQGFVPNHFSFFLHRSNR